MATAPATVCKPNFSRAGRIRRQRVGIAGIVITVGLGIVFAALHTGWYVRSLVFVPAAMAAVTLLQVTRNTCVAHAAKGNFENEDFSTTKQDDADAAASRRVAATIYRDAILIGIVVAAVASATAFV
jgi:hypothetical protein